MKISFIVLDLPCGIVGVGVTILPLRDGFKVNDVLAGKMVLLVRDNGVSTLVST